MKFVYPLLVVLLAVFAVAPLEYPGAFQSHTGLLAYYNLISLDQNPLQFFNWAPTVGHAFDLFRTDGALPYIFAEIFHRLGFGYLDAIKLVYALAWIASGLAMYALAREWLSENGALLAATVYVYLPYHIATVYVRGAFAESVAWAVMPVALLAVVSEQSAVNSEQSTVNSQRSTINKTFTFSLLTFTFLFLTQPGLAILFAFVVLGITGWLNWRAGKLAHWLIGSYPPIIGGLALGALLYAPAILRNGAHIARDGFNANFVLPFQLFSSLWGFGASTGSFLDQFPFQLGVVPVGLAIIAVALGWRAENPARRIVAIFLGVALVLMLLTFEITAPLWNALGTFVTYPWQLLAFVGLVLAFVAGAAIEFDARLTRPAMLAVFITLPIVASYNYLAPRYLDANPARPQIAIFGNNEIALLDYRIVGPLRHGATLRVQLTWQALRPIYNDYTLFIHAVHDNGETYGQVDERPQAGNLPTTKWIPGQVLADTHMLQIDVDGPSEGFHLEVGLYKAATGERALTNTGSDQLILPRPGDPEPTISDQLPPSPSR